MQIAIHISDPFRPVRSGIVLRRLHLVVRHLPGGWALRISLSVRIAVSWYEKDVCILGWDIIMSVCAVLQ